MTGITRADRIAGAVYGLAYGDTWGYVTEFFDYEHIMRTLPGYPIGRPQVSDDTQMSISNLAVVIDLDVDNQLDGERPLCQNKATRDSIRRLFAEKHLQWANSPENTRAPGNTCMSALQEYELSARQTGDEGSTLNDSKGCGTIMRSPWLGLLPYSEEKIFTLAVLQAQTTHGNAIAQIAAGVASLVVHGILTGEAKPGELLSYSRNALKRIGDGSIGWTAWDDDLGCGVSALTAFLANGARLYSTYSQHPTGDISAVFGEGWVADEALLTALAAADLTPNNTSAGVERLVYTNGDSDSIAAIGGSFLGALNGRDSIPVSDEHFEAGYNHQMSIIVSYLISLWNRKEGC